MGLHPALPQGLESSKLGWPGATFQMNYLYTNKSVSRTHYVLTVPRVWALRHQCTDEDRSTALALTSLSRRGAREARPQAAQVAAL